MSSSTGAASRVLSPTSIASSFQYVTASDRHSEVPTSSDESFGSISDETSSDDDEIVWSVSDLSASSSSHPAAAPPRSPSVLSDDDEYIFLSPPLSQPQSGMSSLSASLISTNAGTSSADGLSDVIAGLNIAESDNDSIRPTSQASSRRRRVRRSARIAAQKSSPKASDAPGPVATPKPKKKRSRAKVNATSASTPAPGASKPKKKKVKAAKAQGVLPASVAVADKAEEAGLGERPIVDDSSELGDTKAAVYNEAVQYVSEVLSASTPAEKAKSNLTFLQALILELGLLTAPVASESAQPFYQLPSLPRSLKAAKALLKSSVFLNVRDYLDVRHKGLDALRNVMHPSRKALIKDLSRGKGQRKVPRAYVKNSGLGVLLVSCYH